MRSFAQSVPNRPSDGPFKKEQKVMNQNLPEDPQLREMVKAALAHKVTRRAVLGGAVAT